MSLLSILLTGLAANLFSQFSVNYGSPTLITGANSSFGYRALKGLHPSMTGEMNTALGHYSSFGNTSGSGNTAGGFRSLVNNDYGNYNTAFGTWAMATSRAGSEGTAIGYRAMERMNPQSQSFINQNVAVGAYAMQGPSLLSLNTGNQNTALGDQALMNVRGGSSNVALGFQSMDGNTSGNGNTTLGANSDVFYGNLNNATAVGYGALVKENDAIQLGNSSVRKVFVGTGTSATLISGGLQVTGGNPGMGKVLTSDAFGVATWGIAPSIQNTWQLNGNPGANLGSFLGTGAGLPIVFRSGAVKVGWIDADLNDANTLIGYESGVSLMPNGGEFNVGMGYRALKSCNQGNNNTAVGFEAMQATTSGGNNTAVAKGALFANAIGTYNTAVGVNSLMSNTSDSFNTALGANSSISVGSSNSTVIGFGATLSTSNQVLLGNPLNTTVVTSGNFSSWSDGRFKFNISEEGVKGIDFINLLRPVTYNFDTRGIQEFIVKGFPDSLQGVYLSQDFGPSTAIIRSGFIAQEVEQAAKEVGYDFNGVVVPENPENDNYSLAYAQFVVPLVKVMQEQQAMIETRDAEVAALKSQLADQQAQLAELKSLVTHMAQTCCTGAGAGTSTGEPAPTQGGTKASDPTSSAHPVDVFPNPSQGRFTLRIAPLEQGHYEVFDQHGQLILRQALTPGQTDYAIDLSGKASGSYLLRLHSHCGPVATKQLVVE